MDHLQTAFIDRARTALDLAAMGETQDRKVSAFIDVAVALTKAARPEEAARFIAASSNPLAQAVAKAAATGLDSEWGPEAAELAESFVASIAEISLLDAMKLYAMVISPRVHNVLVASGSVANVVAEGAPKPVKAPGLSLEGVEPIKSAAISVVTQEFFVGTGEAGRALIERELRQSVSRGTNAAVVAHYTDSNTIAVTGTGDPLADLRAGLLAAGPSYGYVAAVGTGAAAVLSTSESNRGGMSVRGGTFAPGIHIVAVDGFSGTLVIPASRAAIRDWGLELRSAGHANVDMRDVLDGPSQLVSLWTTNSYGLLCERQFAIGGDATAVLVSAGSP